MKYIKFIIDLLSLPLVKSKALLSYLLNNTLKNELESRLEKGELFPLQHIQRSIRLAKKLPEQDFIILDIGGGIGATLRLYRNYFPHNMILVFEPVEESFRIISKKYGDDPNTKVFNVAASNENSKREINIANRVTSSSILPLASESDSLFYNEKSLGLHRTETIETVRLDDFLKSTTGTIGIMKMDVQGYELNVLQGADEVIKRTSVIVLEAGNHEVYVGSPKYFEIDSYLRQHNFTLYDIIPSVLDRGQLKEWDVIYINNKALCLLG